MFNIKKNGKILRMWFKGDDDRSTEKETKIDGRIIEADKFLKEFEGCEIQILLWKKEKDETADATNKGL